MEEEIKKLDLKNDVRFLDPKELIDQLDIPVGSAIAVFGSSSGFFTLPMAKKMNGLGKIYALEIVKEKIEALQSQAKLAGLANIITNRVNLEVLDGSKLPEDCVDWVFMINMLFENRNKKQIISEALRILRDEGKILIVEWERKESLVGPDVSVRISKEALVELAYALDLTIEKEIKVSEYHYCLIFNKQK